MVTCVRDSYLITQRSFECPTSSLTSTAVTICPGLPKCSGSLKVLEVPEETRFVEPLQFVGPLNLRDK